MGVYTVQWLFKQKLTFILFYSIQRGIAPSPELCYSMVTVFLFHRILLFPHLSSQQSFCTTGSQKLGIEWYFLKYLKYPSAWLVYLYMPMWAHQSVMGCYYSYGEVFLWAGDCRERSKLGWVKANVTSDMHSPLHEWFCHLAVSLSFFFFFA